MDKSRGFTPSFGKTMSKNKSGNKKASPESKLNLVTAILNLVIAFILLFDKLTS